MAAQAARVAKLKYSSELNGVELQFYITVKLCIIMVV